MLQCHTLAPFPEAVTKKRPVGSKATELTKPLRLFIVATQLTLEPLDEILHIFAVLREPVAIKGN